MHRKSNNETLAPPPLLRTGSSQGKDNLLGVELLREVEELLFCVLERDGTPTSR